MTNLTIITPCIRYQNLNKISESIPDKVRWIVIFDSNKKPDAKFIPKNAETYILKSPTRGYPQSNLGIDKVDSGWVYFLDDDTLLHKNLLKTLSNFNGADFIHFNQQFPDGRKRIGGKVAVKHIDKGNFIVKRSLIGNDRFENCASADGMFAEKMYKKAKKPLYLNKCLSVYNALRPIEMSKFTIIIPTMWYYPEMLYNTVKKYQDCTEITEILIVNNREEGRVALPFDKVRIIGSGKNLFVNPAWNLAVEHSKSNKLVFANDDIEIYGDLNAFFKFISANLKDGQAIGPHSCCISMYHLENPKTLSLQKGGASMLGGSGVFMIMNKKSYHVIPKELPIWHGDLIQYEVNQYYVFKGGITIETNMRGTTSKLMTNNEAKIKVLNERKFYLNYQGNGYRTEVSSENVNVVLVMKSGGVYSLKDVFLLSAHIYKQSKNLKTTVYCLTDLVDKEIILNKIHLLPIGNEWNGWWAKMHLFSPKYEHLRPFLFIDLDSCLVRPLASILPTFSYEGGFIALEDFYRRGILASGVMWIPANNEKVKTVWENWIRNPKVIIQKYRGDQEFIGSVIKADFFWQEFKRNIVSFKPKRRVLSVLQGTESLICFHGKPKIWDVQRRIKWVDNYISETV